MMPTRLVLALIMLLGTSTAHGQSNPDGDRLFREGVRLLHEKSYAAACATLEASQRAERNISPLLNLADCREKNGQLATAWSRFAEAVAMTYGRTTDQAIKYRQYAAQRLAALGTRLSTLTIQVTDPVPEGFSIALDGVVLAPAPTGAAIPVDGGPHVIIATAPGFRDWSMTLSVAIEHEAAHVQVPALERLAPTPTTELSSIHSITDRSVAAPPRPGLSLRRKLALGLGAGSLVAAGTGGLVWMRAIELRDEAAATCTKTKCSEDDRDRAVLLHGRAQDRALLTNVALGVAAASLAGAAVLWLTDDPEEPRRITIGPQLGGGTGIAVLGRY